MELLCGGIRERARRSLRVSGDVQREVLYWYDERGDRYLASEEAEQQARQQLETERQQRQEAQRQLEVERQQRELVQQ